MAAGSVVCGRWCSPIRLLGSAAARSPATAPALARHRHPRRRVSSSSSSSRSADDDMEFYLGVFLGGLLSFNLFSVGKVFVEKNADVRSAEKENLYLRAKILKKHEEIARLEKAWEEELAARQKN